MVINSENSDTFLNSSKIVKYSQYCIAKKLTFGKCNATSSTNKKFWKDQNNMHKEGGSKTGPLHEANKKAHSRFGICQLHKRIIDRYLSVACCWNSQMNGQNHENVQCVFGKNGKSD